MIGSISERYPIQIGFNEKKVYTETGGGDYGSIIDKFRSSPPIRKWVDGKSAR